MNSQRIAFVSTFHPYRGGIAQFNARMYREAEQMGHEVRAWNFNRQYPEKLFPGKTQYVTEEDAADAIPNRRSIDSIGPLSWSKTAREINDWNPDKVVMKYWMPFFAPSLGSIAAKVNAPVLVSLDNVTPHEPKFYDKPLNRYFLRRCDRFLAMSQSVRKDVLDFLPSARVELQPHPVYDHFGASIPRSEACRALHLDPEKPVLLFFGFIRDYKGLDLLLKAVDSSLGDVQIVIAGECYGSFQPYQDLIDSHDLKASIHVHERYIDDAEVPLFFSAANACVLPYRSATQSGIAAVALHFATPMISTDVGGLAEYVSHGEDGLLVQEADPVLIRQALADYLSGSMEHSFRNRLAEKRAAFSWRAYVEKLLSL